MQNKRDKEKKLKVKMAQVEVRSQSKEILWKMGPERYHNYSDIDTGEEKRAGNICILWQLRSSPADAMNSSKSFFVAGDIDGKPV